MKTIPNIGDLERFTNVSSNPEYLPFSSVLNLQCLHLVTSVSVPNLDSIGLADLVLDW